MWYTMWYIIWYIILYYVVYNTMQLCYNSRQKNFGLLLHIVSSRRQTLLVLIPIEYKSTTVYYVLTIVYSRAQHGHTVYHTFITE